MNTNFTQNDTTSKNNNNKPIEKPKRKQVKNACVNCQKACKKCDDGRPCKRCIKLGLTATCRDSDRKERKKGVKRGPYKKRQTLSKDKPVYPKLILEEQDYPPQVMVPSQTNATNWPNEFIGYNQPILSLSPTSSFASSDETLHYAYGYADNTLQPIIQDDFIPFEQQYCFSTQPTSFEKLLSVQEYELNLFEEPSYWYPVHHTTTSSSFTASPSSSSFFTAFPQTQPQQQEAYFDYNHTFQQPQLFSWS